MSKAMDLSKWFTDLADAAQEYQDLLDQLSKLGDGEFTDAEDNRFQKWHAQLKTIWEGMRTTKSQIDEIDDPADY